jgi:hypothetical protein
LSRDTLPGYSQILQAVDSTEQKALGRTATNRHPAEGVTLVDWIPQVENNDKPSLKETKDARKVWIVLAPLFFELVSIFYAR